MEILLCLAVAMLAGLFMSRLTKLVKLPAVTAYLVAGILIGPYLLGRLGVEGIGFVSQGSVARVKIISEVALGFIAFSIGNEFRLAQLKEIGKQATVIGIVQAVVATVMVDIVLIALHFVIPQYISLSAALTLGAIAAATAPAATLMVVRQYKAKGKLTDILLPVVALDDAVGLILFAVSFGAAQALKSGAFNAAAVILEPLCEVVLSLALGSAMGILLTLAERFFVSNTRRLCMTVTFVILTVALSMLKFSVGGIRIGFSSLLVCMMMGTMFCNLCDFSPELMAATERWTAPVYVLFFVISGAELELSVFSDWMVVAIGLIFIIVRSAGKCIGAHYSAKWTGCDPMIVKYLGITLLPQAGVALGMCIKAEALGGMDATLVRNIVLFAVLIYELFGPFATKEALIRAGEIIPENAKKRPSVPEAPKHERAEQLKNQ